VRRVKLSDLCVECGEYRNPQCKCERTMVNNLLDEIRRKLQDSVK
jgi:hypothetical protein